MFCVSCPRNTGFVQCYSLGSHKVCCTLVLYFALFSNFCFACFASQTSGLCSAFPSAPVKSVTRFCGFSQNFVLPVLPHKHRVCAVLLPRLPSSLLHACVYFALFRNFLLCVFCLTNIGVVQCFSLRLPSSLQPFGFLCFIQFAFVMRALPNKLNSDFSLAPLEFARFIFCFVLLRFKFVFCVLSLINLIFLRFS